MLTENQERVEAVGDQLRAKIASKFAATTFLAGFAAAILVELITKLWQQSDTAPVHYPRALGAMMAATVLFTLGIIRLDELSMPKRFWPSRAGALPTPGDVGLLTLEDLWALHDRMVFFWRHLTLSGTALTALALLLLIIPQEYKASSALRLGTFWWAAGSAAVAFTYGTWRDKRAPHRDKLVRPVD
jgi:hypothetical protein